MSHKNFIAYKTFTIFCFFLFTSLGINAQTRTATWNLGGSTCVDGSGNYGINLGSASFSELDFSGCNITELDVRIRWAKSDGNCPNPTGTGDSYHNETSFMIQGPTGVQVILVQPGSYSGGTSINFVTTLFNQGSTPVSGTPSTGTFGPNAGNLNNFNGTNPVGNWTLFAGDNAGGDPLIVDYFQVIATSSGGQPAALGFGCGQWNVNAYEGRDYDLGGGTTMYGYYTEPNLSYNTTARWATTPATATGYVGCDPGPDNHTIVSKRTCFDCDVYQIDVPLHDDEAKLFVNGTEVWVHSDCCDAHTNVWTGILDNSATVEMRHGEGGGGSNQGLTLTAVTTTLNAGSHSTSTLTGCLGANYGNLNANAASGGTSAGVGGGTTTYQWQQSFNGGTYNDIGGATGEDYDPPALNAIGTYDFRRRVTDRCGNTAFTTPRRYNIIADPTISMTASPTTICPGESTTLTATTASGTGTCTFIWQSSPNNATWTQIASNTSTTHVVNGINSSTYYRVQRNCTGTGCNDPFSNSVLITADDNANPSISCPANITTNNNAGICGAVVTYTAPVGTDNCPLPSTAQIAGLTSGSTFPIGSTTNTFRVTDASNNTTDCSFTVIVTDTENPQISCPANITTNNDAGVCGAVVTYTTPVGTDNCPGQTTAQIAGLASGATFPLGTTTNTFRVTDVAGNTADCSFDVIVTDAENPQITCPADIPVNNDVGICGAVVNYTTPVGTDNCPGQTTAQIAGLASGATFPLGTTTNTFRVTDVAGNTADCSFDVIVTDAENPQITCPADIPVNNDVGICGAVVNYTTPVGTDNCPGQTTVQTVGLASGATFPVGTTTNTFRVTDASGNTANCSFDVIVTDAENPQISCPADIPVNNDAGICGAVVNYTTPVGTDNCPGQTTVQTVGLASGATFPVGTTTNTFRVTDASGNTANCSFDVIVTDAENPQISCPADINLSTSVGVCEVPVTYTPVGTDNCPGQTTIQTAGLASGDDFPLGITTNTFEVTDAAGNMATCSFDVEITLDGISFAFDLAEDTVCINEGILINQTGGSPVIGTYLSDSGVYSGLGVTNNGNGSFNFDPSIPGLGTHSIAYTYEDGAGCTYFITSVIEILEDPIASISCPDAIIKDCQGPFNCSPTDTNIATLPSSIGAVTGSAAAYVYGAPNPGGDLFIDLPNMPTNTEFELIYTLTSPDGCSSSTSCTFKITGKQADAGKY